MKLTTLTRAGLAAAVLVATAFALSHGVLAEEAPPPAAPTFNKGDNAWMLTSTVLVLLMTIPGLAFFYGGLVRSKNMLSVLTHVFYTVCIVHRALGALRLQPRLHRRLIHHRAASTRSSSRASTPTCRPRPSRSA